MNMENFPSGNKTEVDPDQETLEQREEVIELNFNPEDFHKFESACKKFREKIDGPDGFEKFKKAVKFGTEYLRKKYNNEVNSVALHHIIIGSSGFGLDDPAIKKVDFEGEDSIAKFIDNL